MNPMKRKPYKPTDKEIEDFRQIHQCSTNSAEEFLTKQYYLEVVKNASCIDDLKEVLEHLVRKDCSDDIVEQ